MVNITVMNPVVTGKLSWHVDAPCGSVNNTETIVLRDTGSTTCVVRSSLVKPEQMTGSYELCMLIDGVVKRYLTAVVELDSSRKLKGNPQFVVKKDILYRKYTSKQDDTKIQLAVPTEMREKVVSVAHATLLA